jgi:monoamine oxidase
LLDVAYNIEYGADTHLQSSLNLVYLLGYQNDPQHFEVFGQSDEHYRLMGGNERLPRAIAAALPFNSIRLNSSLCAIAQRPDSTYRLTFAVDNKFENVVADHVILTLPFSVLRRLDYQDAGFNQVKRTAIAELGYGSNAKLHLQFDERLWNEHGGWGVSTGTAYGDTGFQNTWESSRGQDGETGILVNYLGSAGAQLNANPRDRHAVQAYATRFLAELEPVFPRISAQWNGRATLDSPAYNPFSLGSYSFWKVGQYTLFSGAEAEASGQCHFAGEHCSTSFQGYMEGGASEGIRAATEIITG